MDNNIKQVIVIRKDLHMRQGKSCASAAHASMKVLLDVLKEIHSVPRGVIFGMEITPINNFQEKNTRQLDCLEKWIKGTFTKIVVYVKSEEELLEVFNRAKDEGIFCSLIEDVGKTEFNGVPTKTCCAIGPDESEIIDKITGKLPLL